MSNVGEGSYQLQKDLGTILCLTVLQTRLVMLIDRFSCLLRPLAGVGAHTGPHEE